MALLRYPAEAALELLRRKWKSKTKTRSTYHRGSGCVGMYGKALTQSTNLSQHEINDFIDGLDGDGFSSAIIPFACVGCPAPSPKLWKSTVGVYRGVLGQRCNLFSGYALALNMCWKGWANRAITRRVREYIEESGMGIRKRNPSRPSRKNSYAGQQNNVLFNGSEYLEVKN
ncbi:hypothetical protein SAMN05216387_103108 [Nitrosovibrio tenuis]|uniref:Uncharacterized protein n=1 Tax=Nitrosovibrio tenuis TaxID=1233 RepID=A0A1H7K4L7_9PROT|nr:hypothetical protein SAMN05216387_103108 [Nitrosovibrio tenuis]